MLGTAIHDPGGVEGSPGSHAGLGLMDFETRLEPEKRLERVRGTIFGTDTPVEGYEIHVGTTTGLDAYRPAVDLGGRTGGVVSDDNQIFCTYLHGIFDNDRACSALLQWSGLDSEHRMDYQALRENEIDRVADMLEREIGFSALAGIIGLDS